MSLHRGLTDLRNNHFTGSYIPPWFPTSYKARVFVYGPNLLRNLHWLLWQQVPVHVVVVTYCTVLYVKVRPCPV